MGFRDQVEKAWKIVEEEGCITPEVLAYKLNLSPGYIGKVVDVLLQTRANNEDKDKDDLVYDHDPSKAADVDHFGEDGKLALMTRAYYDREEGLLFARQQKKDALEDVKDSG